MNLKEKVKKLRKKLGWSQAMLAEQIGVHTGHVSRIETGRYQPSIELLKKLTQALEVSADYLLNDDEGDFSPVTVENKGLAERIRLISSLEKEEQNAVLKIIDALLTKKKVVDLVAKETGLSHT